MDMDEFVNVLLGPPEDYGPQAVAHDAGEDCDYSAPYCVKCGDCKECFGGLGCNEGEAHVWSGEADDA
jgi:hypothetical protein